MPLEEEQDPEVRRARWEEQAGKVRTGMQQSMLSLLEERGFVKDIAGGRKTLDWLLTEKRIGVYVGVDPTAPSLHVGHLLPLMALYWMYLHGYYAVSLLGGGTVQIGDPSGRTTARSRQGEDVQSMNVRSINEQLKTLWTNVKCLGIKHQYSYNISRKQSILNNRNWLEKLNAVELMRDLGSGMRLGAMLSRDSVKLRMESGEGMSISEFSYPLFQAYDWWSMYKDRGVQLQIGGSDQYGNIIAGMGAVSHMQKIHGLNGGAEEEDPKEAPYGLTTPLLTTASGEKFGKSAGNAVWLDGQMLKPFDLYQYFLRTADADVERYLKLFTFLPLDSIALLMTSQNRDPSKRIAQHALAQEIVELAHGAAEAKKVAMAHKDAFGQGTNTFSLFTLRNAISSTKTAETPTKASAKQISEAEKNLLAYKKAFAASASAITPPDQETPTSPADTNTNKTVITLPLSLLQPGSFPTVLHAAGLAASKSEASRLIASKGAYVLVPNSGSPETPTALRWETIKPTKDCDPNHYLVDFEALVLRSGKSKIQICRVVRDDGAVDGGMEDEVEIHRKS
ncbi:tyrosyl-tRNA synthetase [Pyrenophora tritici-repentis Pt-1C-BFP]|uniref:Tyrosine--tRNA ligase n=1 Tax=Pyrenophora tritici-repentis (strain Pt-1C-BFP) TaxID=426418 RepID=B2WB10_PYRTR|nr:tyrosyl-tRNA synthetase [Pyrenophora tritici-repentis Pt-1C-BFP]EDU50392.1 tyrosyl-tRNA synthetase [Pyrenophora tritici-repentis Pt-1C-BFP]